VPNATAVSSAGTRVESTCRAQSLRWKGEVEIPAIAVLPRTVPLLHRAGVQTQSGDYGESEKSTSTSVSRLWLHIVSHISHYLVDRPTSDLPIGLSTCLPCMFLQWVHLLSSHDVSNIPSIHHAQPRGTLFQAH